MPLQLLFEGTVAKHVESPGENEDAYRIDLDAGRLVMSDGASESFDARSWANLLVIDFIDHAPDWERVAACVADYEALHDPVALSWSKAAAYERGSFATMVIVQDIPESGAVVVDAIGDTLAVWSDGISVIAMAPYSDSAQFDEKPVLLSTRLDKNPGLSEASNSEGDWNALHRCEWSYQDGDTRVLLCMTDALGAWLLRHQEAADHSAIERLLAIRSEAQLLELVEAERAAGRLRRDDTTLVITAVSPKEADDGLPQP